MSDEKKDTNEKLVFHDDEENSSIENFEIAGDGGEDGQKVLPFNYQPLNNTLVFKPSKPPTVTDSGITITSTESGIDDLTTRWLRSAMHEVVAVCPIINIGRELEYCVNPGDRIFLKESAVRVEHTAGANPNEYDNINYVGTTISVDGEEYVTIEFYHVAGKLIDPTRYDENKVILKKRVIE